MGCCFSSLNKFCCVLVHAFLVFRPHSTFAAAATYLRNSNPERWNVYLNDKAKHVLHGQLTSNFAESENSKWLQDRELPPHELFVRYVDREGGQRYERLVQAQQLSAAGHIICPTIYKKYEQQVELARQNYAVTQLSAATAKVLKLGSPTYQRDRFVDLGSRTCTCLFFQQVTNLVLLQFYNVVKLSFQNHTYITRLRGQSLAAINNKFISDLIEIRRACRAATPSSSRSASFFPAAQLCSRMRRNGISTCSTRLSA